MAKIPVSAPKGRKTTVTGVAKMVSSRGLLTGLLVGLMTACTGGAPEKPVARRESPEPAASFEESMPMTAANLRGHKSLYDKGWFIVTSSREALDYAYQHSVVTAGEAVRAARTRVAERSSQLAGDLKGGLRGGGRAGAGVHRTGRRLARLVRGKAREAGQAQVDFGLRSLERSWDFVTGGMYYGRRTGQHWRALKSTWPQYYGNLSRDFRNINEINARIAAKFTTKIEADWDGAFQKAATAFQQEYEDSGQRANTLVAMGDVLFGWLKMFYEGITRPTARTLVVAATAGAGAATYVFTPVADTVMLAGRTIQATGLSVYYVARTTIEVSAPTIEAGFLTGLGLVSIGTGAATHLGGEALGLANQVAFAVAGGAAAAAVAGGETGFAAGKYVALVSYDIATGATKVLINQTQSGVVLGYNALTAVPTHLVLGVSDVFFLGYDGARLVLVRANGQIQPGPGADGQKLDLQDLPVGTVVDLKKLRAKKGVTLEVVSDDPKTVLPILSAVSKDLEQ